MLKMETKKLLMIVAMLFGMVPFSISQVYAQVGEYRNTLAIGVNGGMALNKVSFDPTIKQSYHQGFMGGLTLRYTSEKYFKMLCAVQVEVNYTQMGWKEKIETSSDTYSRTVNYIQVPFLARLGFGKEEKGVMGFLVLGPQVGFYLSDKDKCSGEWSDATLDLRPNHVVEQYDLKIQRKFEYGLTGGFGMEINTRHAGHFLLEGRYYFGLSGMFNDGKADPFGRSANGAIVAKVSYLFDVLKAK